jgi:hypothetical protein
MESEVEQLRKEVAGLKAAIGELAAFACDMKMIVANVPASGPLARDPRRLHGDLVGTLMWLHMDRGALRASRFSDALQALANEALSKRATGI